MLQSTTGAGAGQTDNRMASFISLLPKELIEKIASHLPDARTPVMHSRQLDRVRLDLLSFRQTSRDIEAATRDLFQRTYCTRRALPLDERGISQALRFSEEFPEHAKQASHLSIQSHKLPELASLSRIRNIDPRIVSKSQCASRLIPALRSLPNLTGLDLGLEPWMRKLSPAENLKHDPDYELKSNYNYNITPQDHYYQIFAILSAARQANIRLEKLGGILIDLSKGGRKMSRIEHVFRTNPSLSTLTSVDLTIKSWSMPVSLLTEEIEYATHLASALNSLKKLRSVCLNFGLWWHLDRGIGLTSTFFSELLLLLQLPLLEDFTLTGSMCSSTALLAFVDKQPATLRSFSIRDTYFKEHLDEKFVASFLTKLQGLQLARLTLDRIGHLDGTIGLSQSRTLDRTCAMFQSEKEVNEGLTKLLASFVLNELELDSNDDEKNEDKGHKGNKQRGDGRNKDGKDRRKGNTDKEVSSEVKR